MIETPPIKEPRELPQSQKENFEALVSELVLLEYKDIKEGGIDALGKHRFRTFISLLFSVTMPKLTSRGVVYR